MIYKLDPQFFGFPDPREAEPDGLIAIGGDLKVGRLVEAYASGIFPWPSGDDLPLLWYSLDPRMLMRCADFRMKKSLRRVWRSGRFEVRVDTCFAEVIHRCATVRRRYMDEQGIEGGWITDAMQQAYIEMHRRGLAHSFETYSSGELVGGLYGVSLGRFFSGESMFHEVTDASKIAFCKLVEYCTLHGIDTIDAQQPTEHLASLGAHPVPREEFLQYLATQDWTTTQVGRWSSHAVVLSLGSNMGNRKQLLQDALIRIASTVGPVHAISHYYSTQPWGFSADTEFVNCAAVVDTSLSPHEVLERTLQIEQQLGRKHTTPTYRADGSRNYTSRPIDIDLIFYDSLVLDTPTLQLPHPRMTDRLFVLIPLLDIIPYYRHPKTGLNIQELIDKCNDTGRVSRLD